MKTIDQLCAGFQALAPEQRELVFGMHAIKAVNACMEYADDTQEATTMFGVLMCAALLADGKISDEEFDMLRRFAQVVPGNKFDVDTCKEIAEEMMRDRDIYMQAASDMATGYLSYWDEEDQESVLLCCISICAVDGEISSKEKKWLKALVAAMK